MDDNAPEVAAYPTPAYVAYRTDELSRRTNATNSLRFRHAARVHGVDDYKPIYRFLWPDEQYELETHPTHRERQNTFNPRSNLCALHDQCAIRLLEDRVRITRSPRPFNRGKNGT